MFITKHSIVSAAGLFGGVFGYVAAESRAWAVVAAFGCMMVCSAAADFLTGNLEEDEEDPNS